MKTEKGVTDWRKAVEEGMLAMYLSDFLHHKDGAQNKKNFKFDGELICNEPAPKINSAKLGMIHYAPFNGPEEHIPARSHIYNIIEEADLASHTFSHSQVG
jgi:hypothetical protein